MVALLDELHIPFVCELYTEMPSSSILVTPSHYGIGQRIEKPVLITKEMNHIEDFDVIPNLKNVLTKILFNRWNRWRQSIF